MHVLVANHSSYPDSDGSASAVAEAVREQQEAGADIVTDGQNGWPDPATAWLEHIEGISPGAPIAYPGSPFFLRRPRVDGRLRRGSGPAAGRYERTRQIAARPVKAVLAGPYTLARLAEIHTAAYADWRAVASDLALALSEDAGALARAGATLIQVEEPLILHHPGDVRALRDILEPIHQATRALAQLAVATFYGNAEPLYAQLNSLPGDILALDFPSSPGLPKTIGEVGSAKPLALGLVDASNPELENADQVGRSLERVLHRYVHDSVHLQPSAGLAALPRPAARAKLSLLASVRDRFQRQG